MIKKIFINQVDTSLKVPLCRVKGPSLQGNRSHFTGRKVPGYRVKGPTLQGVYKHNTVSIIINIKHSDYKSWKIFNNA